MQLESGEHSVVFGRSTGATTFLSSIVEDFGSDPVARAMNETDQNGGGSDGDGEVGDLGESA